MATSISILTHQHPNDTHNLYRVTFHEHTIETLVTNTPAYVDNWISETERINRSSLRYLVVGLDVEWRPNQTRNVENPVATLQLCVGRRCLVFQLLHTPGIPQSLFNFLRNPNYTFTGVGIGNDVEKLTRDYGLVVSRTADLRTLAANASGERELMNAGLQQLTSRVLGREMNKPMNVTMSRWDDRCLSAWQVQYASIDAFLSYEIGRLMFS